MGILWAHTGTIGCIRLTHWDRQASTMVSLTKCNHLCVTQAHNLPLGAKVVVPLHCKGFLYICIRSVDELQT